MDQPTLDGINTYFVSKAAASFGLKVVLSGLGGDELFGGYPSFINIPKYQKIKSLPLARQLMKAASVLAKNKLPAKAIEYFQNPDTPNAEYRLIRGLFTDTELDALGWHPVSSFQHPASIIQYEPVIANEMKQSLSPLQFVSFLESTFYMRNQLLRDSDVFSMTHSLELRVPFVDHLLYGTVLPYLDGGFDKSFPKKMLVDAVGDLPNEVVHRPKQGFTFPFADWIRSGKIKDSINDLLTSNKMKDYFNTKALVNLQKDFDNDRVHWSRVWAMSVIAEYLK
jgi:asparagine synthase (glutamine-hydrolysing)